MKISYELQIWHEPNMGHEDIKNVNDALGIPNGILKFSNKRTALLNFEELTKAEKEGRLPSIVHMVLMEYGANKEFPDDGDVITQW